MSAGRFLGKRSKEKEREGKKARSEQKRRQPERSDNHPCNAQDRRRQTRQTRKMAMDDCLDLSWLFGRRMSVLRRCSDCAPLGHLLRKLFQESTALLATRMSDFLVATPKNGYESAFDNELQVDAERQQKNHCSANRGDGIIDQLRAGRLLDSCVGVSE